MSCRECKGRCRVRGVSRQAAEVCHSILALEASPQVSSSGAPHCFQPTSSCRQVKVLSCFAVQFCSTEQEWLLQRCPPAPNSNKYSRIFV